MTHEIIHPEGWLPAKGYANGVLAKDGTLHIGGQIGWDGTKQFVGGGFVGQMRQALKNIAAIVEAAGGQVSDVARLTWFVTDKSVYLAHQAEVGAAYREVFGKHFPAMSMVVVADLIEDEALVEIEATAHIG
ncbi:MAG: RidA family protein [Marinovum algicola]|uniref:Enamine deaminase RidA, house cleaning of reactive enamine intermediates, YjgF/YER057c/UK114 family n=1 Tax=Marinovum algicola TaxID=42444 RepID=A0A975WB50_9RHOB|nr:RidA family protein [Marinovum algicola]AKO99572.1 Putative translation initiation inhibitor, yjgF family [Marinovum algicola DG 898]SEJ70802.1 Enamine deaminase RidA, house cleaning of reactive enamine intermediates, YjgF/YER057c/UK114 family [Marinovum algicola]SLN55509.1 RutC family protein [Marinovum algicola]